MTKHPPRARCTNAVFLTLLVLWSGILWPQSTPSGSGNTEARLSELNAKLGETQKELRESRQELHDLQTVLKELQAQIGLLQSSIASIRQAPPSSSLPGGQQSGETATTASSPENLSFRLGALEEEQAIVHSEVTQQEQTKVESASKYRVKLSGLLLFNAFANFGYVDNQDLASLAMRRPSGMAGNTIGATMRQTILGVEGSGPELGGVKTSANVHFDFFGGFPQTDFGVTAGLVRLRTGDIRMDWDHTSVVLGQDTPFFSPLSPTSLATLGQPGLSWAGNLWTWTPQLYVDHRVPFGTGSTLHLQGGLLDPLDPGSPDTVAGNQSYRLPSHGEQSGQPGYASRISWGHVSGDGEMEFGAGGFISPQSFAYGKDLEAWTGTADWKFPLTNRLQITGEFYRGRAVGGLGGGLFNSVVFNGAPQAGSRLYVPLNSVGAWTQIKLKPASKWEINAAIGHDNPFSRDLRTFRIPQGEDATLMARNQIRLVNCIFRPRSNLVFSVEDRYILTFPLSGVPYSANVVNLGAGYIF